MSIELGPMEKQLTMESTQPASRLRAMAGRVNQYLLVLLALALPLSVSAVSVLALLVLLCWLVEGNLRHKLATALRNPVALALLCYLALFPLGLLWTEDLPNGLAVMKKQWKIAMMPVFLTGLHPAWRIRCLYAFLGGLWISMASTYLAWLDLYHYKGVTPEHPTRGLYHVVYNPLLAFGIYLVLHQMTWSGLSRVRRLLFAVLAGFMCVGMFITEGRTGQMVLFVLLAVYFLQLMRGRLVLGGLLAAVLLPLIAVLCYQVFPTFHLRVDTAWQEILQFRANPATSVGLRLLFWQKSYCIIREFPLFGVGTGDFPSVYAWVNQLIWPPMVPTDNPHNQYILDLCQFGALGFLALLAIFFLQIREAFLSRDGWERIRLAFPLFFLIIMLTESYLVVYETGFLFALWSAVLYGRPLQTADGSTPPVVLERHGI